MESDLTCRPPLVEIIKAMSSARSSAYSYPRSCTKSLTSVISYCCTGVNDTSLVSSFRGAKLKSLFIARSPPSNTFSNSFHKIRVHHWNGTIFTVDISSLQIFCLSDIFQLNKRVQICSSIIFHLCKPYLISAE